jgi:hypothetical protein
VEDYRSLGRLGHKLVLVELVQLAGTQLAQLQLGVGAHYRDWGETSSSAHSAGVVDSVRKKASSSFSAAVSTTRVAALAAVARPRLVRQRRLAARSTFYWAEQFSI